MKILLLYSPNFVLIRKHAVRLNQLLRKAIGQPLHNVRTHTGPSSSCNRVAQHESLQTITAVRLAIDDIEDLFLQRFTLAETTRPIVASSAAILGHEYILRIVQLITKKYINFQPSNILFGCTHLGIRRTHNRVNHSRLQVQQHCSWNIMIIVSLETEPNYTKLLVD